jgi:hypothetical protein
MENIFAFGIFVNVFNYIPWTSVFLLTRYVGIRLYIVTYFDEITRIQRRVGDNFSEKGDNGKGSGYAVGMWYLLHLSSDKAWMISTKASYERLSSDISARVVNNNDDKVPEDQSIIVLERRGVIESQWLKTRNVNIKHTPRENQTELMEKIIAHHQVHQNTVVYLWGPPGTGKSMIGLLLAKKLKGAYCNTIKPWQPNNSIDMLYVEFDPASNKPVVLVFDEVDTAIANIHSEKIEDHKKYAITTKNKAGWNQMLDQIQRGMYPHLILLMTSNKTPDYIREMDPSYIRDGRVNLILEL